MMKRCMFQPLPMTTPAAFWSSPSIDLKEPTAGRKNLDQNEARIYIVYGMKRETEIYIEQTGAVPNVNTLESFHGIHT